MFELAIIQVLVVVLVGLAFGELASEIMESFSRKKEQRQLLDLPRYPTSSPGCRTGQDALRMANIIGNKEIRARWGSEERS